MARKGNRQKNGLDNLSNHKKGVADSGCPNTKGRGKVNLRKVVGEEKLPNGDCTENNSTMEVAGLREENGRPPNRTHELEDSNNRSGRSPSGFHTDDTVGNLEISDSLFLRHFTTMSTSHSLPIFY
ncbi:hypothetical protein Vadar_017707 [Vaccinium darrowii]|uniref:Uncharacterized protein n=1 Tax=Vaccinium darrowii TaxID=229202 RepID=A0ACB7YMY8_9ERIC|nr:hypothetical protein Vadar_017707 [Vaccinium darrowii]